jgi:hypothetical protein
MYKRCADIAWNAVDYCAKPKDKTVKMIKRNFRVNETEKERKRGLIGRET